MMKNREQPSQADDGAAAVGEQGRVARLIDKAVQNVAVG